MISKEEFLIEHNRLSPLSLQTTLILLNRFKDEKRPLLKDNGWSIDKLRIPLITWLLSLPLVEKEKTKTRKGKSVFTDYPHTKC